MGHLVLHNAKILAKKLSTRIDPMIVSIKAKLEALLVDFHQSLASSCLSKEGNTHAYYCKQH